MMGKYIRAAAGIMMALLVFGRLGHVLAANYDGNQSMDGFYRLERDTVDVMFYGSSHVYAGVNVVDLWDDYGIAGYNLAGTMQTLWNTYYNMEETLKYQSPKVMVVDLYGLLIEDEYYGSSNVIKNVSSMRFSLNKIKNVWSSVPHEEFLTYLASYPLTHDSNTELKRGNYDEKVNNLGGEWYKGYRPTYAVTEYGALPQIDANPEKAVPTEKNREYLDKMVAFAKEHQIQLMFMVVPYAGLQKQDQSLYRWAEEYAGENGVPFLNGNLYLKEMGFHPATDYAEASHLNYSGSCKYTAYLGEWLTQNYELTDRRGGQAWDSWQKYSDCYAAYRANLELKGSKDVESYLRKLEEREDYLIIISLDNQYKENELVGMLEEFMGIDPYELDNSASVVLDNGTIRYQTPAQPKYLWYTETDLSDIAVVRGEEGSMEVLVNNQVQNHSFSDVTIMVYDKTLDTIADVVSYNADGVLTR